MKKIKQAQEKESSDSRQSQKNLFQEAFYQQAAIIKFHAVLLSVTIIPNQRLYLPTQATTIFQPPRVS